MNREYCRNGRGVTFIFGYIGVVQLGGSSTRFSWVNPTKVEARKSFLFTESYLVLKIKNTWNFKLDKSFKYQFSSMLYAAAKW